MYISAQILSNSCHRPPPLLLLLLIPQTILVTVIVTAGSVIPKHVLAVVSPATTKLHQDVNSVVTARMHV